MNNFAFTLDYHADRRPRKVVLTHGERRVTNEELLSNVNAIASALRGLGLGRGDVVGLLLHNRVEFIELVYAINRLGAVFLPLNYRLAPAEWQFILGHAEVKALFSELEFTVPVDAVARHLPHLKHRIVVDGPATGPWLSYAQMAASGRGAVVEAVDVDGADLQRLMYTSGTTSRPKGVRITHHNVMYKNLGMMVQFGWTDADVTAVAGPLYHVGALDMGGITTLHAGGSLVMQSKFAADPLIDLIVEHRPTNIWLAPAMVNALLQVERLATADLSSIRLIMSGGEKMPEARLKQVLEVFPGVWFADAYGLTETVSSDTFVTPEHVRDKLGSVGRPVPHMRVRVVDDDGTDAPPGTIGEIVLRGPKVFGGYWRDPEATATAIRDGWFHTGDMGHLDTENFLYIDDRKKDMIVSGGENIATPEVERVLYEHPDILEAAVIGMPHSLWGEVPHAFVVLRAGSAATAGAIEEFCRAHLAKFKVPARIDLVDELPRTPTGKVLKRTLREYQQQATK